jgi:plasmid maintenance system killer protein
MVRELGLAMARRLMLRLQQLEAALNLAEMALLKQGRLHELAGDREGQLSLDLVHPMRLILIPDHEPIPRLPEGGLALASITAVLIFEIIDTH